MVTLVDAEQSILARFVANWTGTPASRLIFENEGHSTVDADESPWLRLAIQELTREQITLGAVGQRKYESKCRVFVQVMTPVNSGARKGKELGEQVRSLLEGETFSDLYFYDCSVRGAGSDEKWLMTVVDARFDFWETK
jgi:hypothetical protein